MKNIIIAAMLAFSVNTVWADASAPKETRRVCVDVKDKEGKPVKNKDGSTKQNCKEVKQHKKLEGTPVPDKK